jgi:hypothetical protein
VGTVAVVSLHINDKVIFMFQTTFHHYIYIGLSPSILYNGSRKLSKRGPSIVTGLGTEKRKLAGEIVIRNQYKIFHKYEVNMIF